MSYRDRVEAERRLIILRLLMENGGAASESVIERGLLDLGERVGMDRQTVRRMIRELETSTCVVVELFQDKLLVPEITKFGVAVAQGRMTVDGVAKPSLGV
ncbi:MAG TPA: AsnC family protein [Caulobacter sp.]|nr:AsnC family protein [Caulobacter sp.]